MKDFIIYFLNKIGLGVTGSIHSYKTDKIRELFPDYDFIQGETVNGQTRFNVLNNKTGKIDLILSAKHNSDGIISDIDIINV